MDIHIVWALIIVFSLLMYTIFDGFDLGIGSLMLFFKKEEERDTIVDTITPVWDGNESWIVLAGVGLFGGFPTAYAALLPALYIPVIVMIVAMALRGVSMEFRFLAKTGKTKWDIVFSVASLVASFCQGLILGNVLEGITPRTAAVHSTINAFYFITPFTFCAGILVVLLYMLIGANWLNFKTGHVLQQRVKKIAPVVLLIASFYLVIFILARKYLDIFQPRFHFHGDYAGLFLPSPLWFFGAVLLLYGIWYCLKFKKEGLPFTLNILLFVYLGVFVISHLWPFLVAPEITLDNAGSPVYGNTILLYGALIVIPVILSYLLYSYSVFKGKTGARPDYEPELAQDRSLLQREESHRGVVKLPVNLGLLVKVFLKLFWLVLFFIILGFLGDDAALGTIILFITIFCVAWYRNAQNESNGTA